MHSTKFVVFCSVTLTCYINEYVVLQPEIVQVRVVELVFAVLVDFFVYGNYTSREERDLVQLLFNK